MKLLHKMVIALTSTGIPVTFFHDEYTGAINGSWDEAPATIFVGDFIHMTVSHEQYVSIVCDCEDEDFQFGEFNNINDAVTWIKELFDNFDFEYEWKGVYNRLPNGDYELNRK